MEENINKVLYELDRVCCEAKEAKYILLNKSVSNILKVIAKNKELYNIVAENILGFNFDLVLKKCKKSNGFCAPTEDKILVPFVFCLLNSIDDNKLDFINFLKSNYGSNLDLSFEKFCDECILGFSYSIKNLFNQANFLKANEEYNKTKNEKIPVSENDLINRASYLIRELNEQLKTMRFLTKQKKIRASTILKITDECLIDKQIKYAYGLFLGLKSTLGNSKKYKKSFLELENVFALLSFAY